MNPHPPEQQPWILPPTPPHITPELKLPILFLPQSSFSTLNANTNPTPNCQPGHRPWTPTLATNHGKAGLGTDPGR